MAWSSAGRLAASPGPLAVLARVTDARQCRPRDAPPSGHGSAGARAFWKAAGGRATNPALPSVRQLVWYPQLACPRCGGERMPWTKVAGRPLFTWVRCTAHSTVRERSLSDALVALEDDPTCVATLLDGRTRRAAHRLCRSRSRSARQRTAHLPRFRRLVARHLSSLRKLGFAVATVVTCRAG